MTPENERGWTALRIWSEMYEDAQKARIACENRVRGDVDAEAYTAQLQTMKRAEEEWAKGLKACYRRVVPASVIEWQKSCHGIGEHSLARLLGVVGHPRIAQPYHWEGEGDERTLVGDEPFVRTVSQLWAYCGHGDPARKRRRGMSAEEAFALGNPRAKTLTFLIAVGCVKKMKSPFRAVYDDAREHYKAREDWTPGHQHNAAIRKTGKEILKQLWIAAA